jgi:signal transduction histidine kinase/ligand-binding sensor domain-containing protein
LRSICPDVKDDRSRSLLRAFLLLGFLGCFSAGSAAALNPETLISQYGHATWRVQEGYLNGSPISFAQTPDGYLWIGTNGGLYRFDGVSFTGAAPSLSSSQIQSLYTKRDGSLWVGYQGGISRIVDGKLTTSLGIDGEAEGITEDRDGAIWFSRMHMKSFSGPICKVVGERLRCYGEADGIQTPTADAIATYSHRQLWFGGAGTLVEWNGKQIREYPLAGVKKINFALEITALAVDASGTVWVANDTHAPGGGLRRWVNGKWESNSPAGWNDASHFVRSLFFDRENCLWVGTEDKGLYRIRGNSIDHYGRTDGLSSDVVEKIFEDREGGIWVATHEGVDHFYDLPIVTYSNTQGVGETNVAAVLGRHDGSVAVSAVGTVYSIRGSTVTPLFSSPGAGGFEACMLEDHRGNFYLGRDDGALMAQSNGRLRVIIKGDPTGVFISLTEDTDHAIWAVFAGPHHRLFRIVDDHVREDFLPRQIPAAYSVIADPHGGVWLATLTRKLMRYEKGEWRDVPLDSIARRYGRLGGIFNMAIDGDGTFWGTTTRGLVGYRDGNLQLLGDRNGLPCRASGNAVVSDRHNDLWVQGTCGLIRIAHSELERWWADPEIKINVSTYDATDGFKAGTPVGRPAATLGSDGRVWFQNNDVAMAIDPDHPAANTVVPPVHVQQVIADRIVYAAQNGLRLPVRARQVELDYTGLSFVKPSKVQFRYLLEGHDTRWQEPGTRRAAFYNDLAPGQYTFRVIAANNSGLWNMQGASLQFTIPPAYYQTNWFRAICVLALLGVLWLLYQLRLRQLQEEFNVGLETRVQERTRLACDLHDTLLQTIQASKYVADAALKCSADANPVRGSIEQLSVWLGQAIEEGRATLNSLRTSITETNDLAETFRRAIEECRIQSSLEATFSLVGEVSAMHPIVRDEVYRIGYEAIRNACAHSQATQLQVVLAYAEDLILCVSDNGVGIDPAFVSEGKQGHFGLQGMRERAGRIRAKLTVETSPGSGTEIKLIVPGRIIYRGATSGRTKWSELRSLLKRRPDI